VASGEAMANASADSIARSIGIAGSGGDDDIDMADESFDINELSIHTHSRSDAAATAVSVTLAGAVGAANGATVADASATGESFSTGIDGGSGKDDIDNSSAIEATAEADATASSTAVTVTISAGAADSVGTGDSGATARATTAGIDGGDDGGTIGPPRQASTVVMMEARSPTRQPSTQALRAIRRWRRQRLAARTLQSASR